ncbi:GNAT family N-acetyltransferase [Streptomyces sp. NPDC093252]|uniref:GNAT family N-acetyltransferase n=1 Tax=Streptomyces sp. NPDC093252 TaxID=3154980 RepID=UPI00344377E1
MDADLRAAALPSTAPTPSEQDHPAPSEPDHPTAELRVTALRDGPSPGAGEPGGGLVTVRFMDTQHLAYVVGEHLRHFPGGFFARLGRGFLTAYTRTHLTSPHATGFVAELDGEPVGYLVGVIDPALHRRHLLRDHGLGLALRGLAALALRPAVAARFLRTRLPRYLRTLLPGRLRALLPAPPAPEPVPEQDPGAARTRPARSGVLSHVAVSERARSLGIGSVLIERFTDFAVLAGCDRISLVTAAGPGGAGPYYERRGWHPDGETRTPDGVRFLLYAKTLPGPALPAPRRPPTP